MKFNCKIKMDGILNEMLWRNKINNRFSIKIQKIKKNLKRKLIIDIKSLKNTVNTNLNSYYLIFQHFKYFLLIFKIIL